MSLIERIHWLDAAIRDGAYPNPDTLKEKFGVSRRTAQSDYAHLRDNLGAPVDFHRDRGGWYYTEPAFALTCLLLTTGQRDSLQRAVQVARAYLGEHDAETLEKVIASASPLAPPPPPPVEAVYASVRLTHDVGSSPELLEDCHRAVRDRQKMWIRYYSARKDEETERLVQPYVVINEAGERHLIAWCELRDELRQFFAGRIRDWKVLNPTHAYSVDPGFDLQEYRRGFVAWHGEEPTVIRIKFSPYQSRWAREREFHDTQTIEEQPDGGVILTMRVAGMGEVLRWVLSYGPEAEVLEPQSLRTQVADAAKKISEIYNSSKL